MNIFCLSEIFSQLKFKKDTSAGPTTAFEKFWPYFESMGQWPGPNVNLKLCKGRESFAGGGSKSFTFKHL